VKTRLHLDFNRCPYCNSETKKVDSSIIYGKSYGTVLVCSNYPVCDAFVGTHKSSGEPLGRLANPVLREYKKKAHAAFDILWQSGKMTRTQAYKLLSKKLRLPVNITHIGYFDVDECKRVIEICTEMTDK